MNLQPGLALLAGSSRLIQFFPGASKGGLLMAAGFASATSVINDWMYQVPEHEYLETLMGKAAAIAAATICTGLAAKALQGRADISFQSAIKFGIVELVFAAIIAKATQGTPLQRQHRYYTTHQKEWRALEKETRSALVNEFYQAGLPAISLFNTNIDLPASFPQSLDQLSENLDTYSAAQLSWLRESLINKDNASAFGGDYEKHFRFMQRCQEMGVEMLRCDMICSSILEFLRDKPHYIDMLYREFQQTPVYRFYLQEDFDDLFQRKDPLPTLEEACQQLDVSKVETMDPQLLQVWHQPTSNSDFSNPITTAFVKRFFELSFEYDFSFYELPDNVISWINDLSEEDLEALTENQVEWLYRFAVQNHSNIIEFRIIDALIRKGKNPDYPFSAETVQAIRDGRKEIAENLLDNLSTYTVNARELKFFFLLNESDQEYLRDIWDKDTNFNMNPLPYRLTPELVEKAKGNKPLKDKLIAQYASEHWKAKECFGFSDLTPKAQGELRDLFGDQAHLLV